MIPVAAAKEPPDFHEKVRQKGSTFLMSVVGQHVDWSGKEYWRECIDQAYQAYSGVCAYYSFWMPRYNKGTIDHFLPKSKHPNLAYEWSNYRLSCAKANSCKHEFEDVIDPFQLSSNWFQLDFPSLLVLPAPSLDDRQRDQVQKTIRRLKLNDDDFGVKARYDYVIPYARQEISFSHLSQTSPFLAYELERQGLKQKISTMLKAQESHSKC